DLVGGAGPDVDDLVIALAVGDDPATVLTLDLADLLPGRRSDLWLVLRNDHIVDSDGDPGLRRDDEAEFLQCVVCLDRAFRRSGPRRLENNVPQLALRHREVDETKLLRPNLVKDNPTNRRADHLLV